MKNILIVLSSLFSLHAAANCVGQASFTAKIQQTQKLGNTCAIYINASTLEYFSTNSQCPISAREILDTPLTIQTATEYYCSLETSDEVSGQVYRLNSGELVVR